MNLEDIRDEIWHAGERGYEVDRIEVGPDVAAIVAAIAYPGRRQLGTGEVQLVVREMWGYPVSLRRENGYRLVMKKAPPLLGV